MTDAAETLSDLHTNLVDAIKGYDEAIKDAKIPEIIGQFEKMRALHAESVTQLAEMLERTGAPRNDDGSYMATVHRTAISLRAMVTGLDASSLSAFVSGERLLLEKYGKAITSGIKASDEAILVAQSDKLNAAVRHMQEMMPA